MLVSLQDDFRVCMHYGVFKKGDSVVCPVDSTGKFTEEVTDFVGQHVKVCACVRVCVRVTSIRCTTSVEH